METSGKQILTARRPDGRRLDDEDLRGYGIEEDQVGQYAVIQLGYACIGLGDSAEAALADAERCSGEPVVLAEAGSIGDGSVVCVEIEIDVE
jgi:hypothetical protein